MQKAYVHQLGLEGPYIGCNGGLVINSVDDSLVFSKTIDPQAVESLSVLAGRLDLHTCLQTIDAVYFTRGNPRTPVYQGYMQRLAERGLPLVPILDLDKDFGNYDGSPAYKLVCYIPEEDKLAAVLEFLGSEPELTGTISGEHLLDIMPRGIDKGKGIERVADYYGIPLSQVCAFGDYDNDIPSFQRAGFLWPWAMPALTSRPGRSPSPTPTIAGHRQALAALEDCFLPVP